MATIKNLKTFAPSRDKARLIAKELGGKIQDCGIESGNKRWLVIYDRVLKLDHRVQVSNTCVHYKDRPVAVIPKSEAVSFQAFSMSWVAA